MSASSIPRDPAAVTRLRPPHRSDAQSGSRTDRPDPSSSWVSSDRLAGRPTVLRHTIGTVLSERAGGQTVAKFDVSARAGEADARAHGDRVATAHVSVTVAADGAPVTGLPDSAFVVRLAYSSNADPGFVPGFLDIGEVPAMPGLYGVAFNGNLEKRGSGQILERSLSMLSSSREATRARSLLRSTSLRRPPKGYNVGYGRNQNDPRTIVRGSFRAWDGGEPGRT